MRLNVSELKDRLLCPAYHHYRHIENRHPFGISLAPSLGSAWHRAMAVLFEHGDHPRALAQLEADTDHVCQLVPESQRTTALRESEVLCLAFEAFRLPLDWTVLAIEREMQMPLGRHTLFGTPDLVVERQGALWHVQHKTCSSSTSIPSFMRGIQRSWHEAVYNELIAQTFKRRPAGVICIAARKLSLKAAQTSPEALTVTEYMPIPHASVLKALDDIEILASRLEAEHALTREVPTHRPIQNRDSCFRNNSLCAYVNVCDGKVSLADDALFRSGQEEAFSRA